MSLHADLSQHGDYLSLVGNHNLQVALGAVRSALVTARAEVSKLEAAERALTGNQFHTDYRIPYNDADTSYAQQAQQNH